jgi:hypothetical protein
MASIANDIADTLSLLSQRTDSPELLQEALDQRLMAWKLRRVAKQLLPSVAVFNGLRDILEDMNKRYPDRKKTLLAPHQDNLKEVAAWAAETSRPFPEYNP